MTSNANLVHTKALGDTDNGIDLCSAWVMAQWGLFIPGRTIEHYSSMFNDYAQSEGIPHTRVAFVGDQAVGMAGVRDREPYLPESIDYGPWLTMVFVHPNFRNQGVASELVKSIERHTASQGITEMYLDTTGSKHLYETLGWETISDMPNPINEGGQETSQIMKKTLG